MCFCFTDYYEGPEKERTGSWFLLHDNVPAHQSVLGVDFLAKNKVTTMEHPSILLTWLQLNLPAASTEISIEGSTLL
jgi:hypothetical protein